MEYFAIKLFQTFKLAQLHNYFLFSFLLIIKSRYYKQIDWFDVIFSRRYQNIINNNNKKDSTYTLMFLNTIPNKIIFVLFMLKNEHFKLFKFFSEIYEVRSFIKTLNFAENFDTTYTHIYCNASFLFSIWNPTKKLPVCIHWGDLLKEMEFCLIMLLFRILLENFWRCACFLVI